MEFEFCKRFSKTKVQNVNLEIATKAKKDIKTYKLSLPIFSKHLREWLSFNDIFKASFHESQNLSVALKLQISSFSGDAFRIIQFISLVDSNYVVAWSLLEEHYSNAREQVYVHWKLFKLYS